MANATALQPQNGRLLGLALGDWEVSVRRRSAVADAAPRAEATFVTGVRWALGGVVTGLVLLVAALNGVGV